MLQVGSDNIENGKCDENISQIMNSLKCDTQPTEQSK